ncbi:TPA: ribulose-phosphate 3-epimerase [Candidatus Poribacteria bacterium]|nr:ribulose-phosphate 3-epimerase [Candidatus Poribacteria bacterium]
MVMIEASILSADFARLGEQACEAEAAGVDAIQVDVMDGCFVPNITFGAGVVRALRPLVHVPLEIHFMIVEPERYLTEFADAGANRLIVHQETCAHLYRILQSIRELGIEAGVTLNPGTPLSAIEEVLDIVDLVQVMTVNPGFGGQSFIHGQLDKVRRLRQRLDELGQQNTPIAIDGGINTTTAPLVVNAGATIIIAGSSIYNDRASVAENVTALRASLTNR